MAAAKDRPLPAEVVEKAKHHILDTFAAIISGSELPPGHVALALGEELGATGKHYLRAVTLGYDVGCRYTMALGGITFRNESRRGRWMRFWMCST